MYMGIVLHDDITHLPSPLPPTLAVHQEVKLMYTFSCVIHTISRDCDVVLLRGVATIKATEVAALMKHSGVPAE